MRTHVGFAPLGSLGVLVLAAVAPSAFAQLAVGAPAPLNSNAATDSGSDTLPVVATDRAGHWVSVWASDDTLGDTIGADYDILVARSMDNGQTWTAPEALNSDADTDTEFDGEYSPVVATDGGGHWVAAWYGSQGIAAATSDDNGETWTDPVVLSPTGSFPSVTADGKGNWLVVWEATDPNAGFFLDSDIFAARSVDDGATWTSPGPVNTYAGEDSGGEDGFPVDDLRPNVTTDGNGTWLTAWEWHVGSIYDVDILFSISTDNGLTWSSPSWLNSNNFNDGAADYTPVLTTDTKGNWVAVWWSNGRYRLRKGVGTPTPDFNVLTARSRDNGRTWTWPKPLNTNAWTDKGGDYRPTVATDGRGNWVAAWESDDTFGDTLGKDDDMLFAHSTNNGRTWTDPAPLNANAATDEKLDGAATLANDGEGNWVAAWHSKDSLEGTIGTDLDILSTTFEIAPRPLLLRAPNGGEVWQAGTTHKIEWEHIDAAGPKVTIELMRDGAVVALIKAQTPNDGGYLWTLDAGLAPYRTYRVRITSATDAAIADESDGKFQITGAR